MPGKESLASRISFALKYPVWIFHDSTHQSIFSVCFPPSSFCTCSGHIVSITKSSQQRRWIACNRPHAAGPDTGKSCTVGGIWFPEHLSLLCSGRCPRTNTLGPAFAQKGTRSWLICQPHGDKETWPGAAGMPLHTPVYTTECCPQWALALCAKVERKFPDEVCFWTENWSFIYSFVWYVPFLRVEFPTETWLFLSQRELSLPEGNETSSKQFHSSSSLHQWLLCSVVHYHHLGSLAFLIVLFGGWFPLFVWIILFLPEINPK